MVSINSSDKQFGHFAICKITMATPMMMLVYLAKVQLKGEPIQDRFISSFRCRQCHQHQQIMQHLSHQLNNKTMDRRDQLALEVHSDVD